MDIQLEKINLIKHIADLTNEDIIRRLKSILSPETALSDDSERILANQPLVQKITGGRKEIKDSNGVKVDINKLWS